MDYLSKTTKELVVLCKERKKRGYSGKKKEDLIRILVNHSVENISPLRYPGGKTRAIPILETYVTKYFPGKKILLSPFFGGGSFELYMLSRGFQVKANDLFVPLYKFWKMKQDSCQALVESIRQKIPVTKEKFQEFRNTIMTETDSMTIASLFFLINRCSFSGATLSGGFSKEASEKRLTESSFQRLLDCNVETIQFTNVDCNVFLTANPETADTLVYADPPYYIESYLYGRDGDMHESFSHALFAETIKKRSDWILSYNNCEYIRNLYSDCRIFEVSWSYGMNADKESSEILILPPVVREQNQRPLVREQNQRPLVREQIQRPLVREQEEEESHQD
jgi:DNA adenine methylase